jgi:uncharacterized protein (TIGR02996 family)
MEKPIFGNGPSTIHSFIARAVSYRSHQSFERKFQQAHVVSESAAELARLAEVLAAPEQDEPRRLYAHWCESVGNGERAAFIRAQLRGETATPNPQWAAAFTPYAARGIVYQRGFVETLSLAGRAFLAHGDTILALAPIRHVKLVAIAPFLDELATCPAARRLKTLDLRGNRIHRPACEALGLHGVTILCDA